MTQCKKCDHEIEHLKGASMHIKEKKDCISISMICEECGCTKPQPKKEQKEEE